MELAGEDKVAVNEVLTGLLSQTVKDIRQGFSDLQISTEERFQEAGTLTLARIQRIFPGSRHI